MGFIGNCSHLHQKLSLYQLVAGKMGRASLPLDLCYIFIEFSKATANGRVKFILDGVISGAAQTMSNGRPLIALVLVVVPIWEWRSKSWRSRWAFQEKGMSLSDFIAYNGYNWRLGSGTTI